MSKKITKSQFYKSIIDEALEGDETTIEGYYYRICSEKQFKKGNFTYMINTIQDWLQGLAIACPFMNHEIVERAFDLNYFELDIENYWNDLALALYDQFVYKKLLK